MAGRYRYAVSSCQISTIKPWIVKDFELISEKNMMVSDIYVVIFWGSDQYKPSKKIFIIVQCFFSFSVLFHVFYLFL